MSNSPFVSLDRAALGWTWLRATAGLLAIVLCAMVSTSSLHARDKTHAVDYGAELSVSVPVNEQQLLLAVEDVAADGIIQGTKEYNKDEYVAGAEAVDSSSAFPKWSGSGKVFYKVRKEALDPRNFKDSGDTGTLAVRYVVQHGDDKSTILKIAAVFVDDFHRRTHLSNGSVEAAEYKEIQDHLAAIQVKKQEAAEELQHHQQELAAKELERKRAEQKVESALVRATGDSLQQHVELLRRETEREVKPPGSQLRSAPFHSALSLKPLPAGSRVVVLISTPYWYGVEAEDGQHGWIHRRDLEQLP